MKKEKERRIVILGNNCLMISLQCVWGGTDLDVYFFQLTWLNLQLEKIWPFINEVNFHILLTILLSEQTRIMFCFILNSHVGIALISTI